MPAKNPRLAHAANPHDVMGLGSDLVYSSTAALMGVIGGGASLADRLDFAWWLRSLGNDWSIRRGSGAGDWGQIWFTRVLTPLVGGNRFPIALISHHGSRDFASDWSI
jgi:hypothetical protein